MKAVLPQTVVSTAHGGVMPTTLREGCTHRVTAATTGLSGSLTSRTAIPAMSGLVSAHGVGGISTGARLTFGAGDSLADLIDSDAELGLRAVLRMEIVSSSAL